MSMNPRTTTEKIRKDYKQYVSSILTTRDPEISRLAMEEVYNTGFVKGPFLETTLPFKDGKSLKELAEDGIISKEFSVMGSDVHYEDWKLRIHQQHAIEHIVVKQRNMVVSTGTGSGKTECYLYPIFNHLMREKEEGKLDSGVRALLIFPMNALANDQQKKLRKLLASYPDITFGRYTRETKHRDRKRGEEPEDAEKRLHDEYDNLHKDDSKEYLRKSLPNELMCREYMAENPPHILLTNYAMLEYMLLQPNTAPFFDDEKAKNWQFIVIDEAHTYKGAVGTEIGFLLRRLKERIRHHMDSPFRCIATSATLGSVGGEAALAEFASQLFGEPFSAEDVITTERKKREPQPGDRLFRPDEYITLKKQVDGMPESEKGKLLYEQLVHDSRLFMLYEVLNDKPKNITEVAEYVFSDVDDISSREKGLINLIELSAAAKRSENEAALLPARYHIFVKSLEGMFVEFYPQKRVFLDRKERYKDYNGEYTVFEMANCQKCNQEYIIGKTITKDEKNYLVQTSSHDKPELYFISDKEINGEFDADDDLEESANLSSLEKYRLCLSCGRITNFAERVDENCCDVNDSKKIVTVYNLKYTGAGKESNCCPACGATKEGLIKRFLTANQPATFAVAKSLYDAIPPRPQKNDATPATPRDYDDLFGDFMDEQEEIDQSVIDESGRKLLIFSDNRQEAAYFAGSFEKRYRQTMWRRLLLNCIKEAENGEITVDDLISKAREVANSKGLYALNLVKQGNDPFKAYEMGEAEKREMAAHYIMQEFISPDIGTGLEGMGYIQIMPEEMPLNENASRYGVTGGKNIWNLYRFVFDTMRQKGITSFPSIISAEDEFFSPRNHVSYFRSSENGKLQPKGYIWGFLPAEGRDNKRITMFKKVLGKDMTDEKIKAEAIANLKQCYDDITDGLKGFKRKGYVIDGTRSDSGQIYTLNYKKWKIKYITPETELYRCNKCGKIFNYSVLDICPEFKCDGQLEAVLAKDVRKNSYYDSLYDGNQYIPMVAREHTAQLSASTAGDYQKLFEDGSINVLSCSTTFEMGVDVGELEATFQRNVPPETSNYIQRAGRAGRRTSSAAFSVTFARRNSHDMTFFRNPAEIISGKIAPPVLEMDNEKIAQRHLNSVVISTFFKLYPDYFTGKTEKIVSYSDGQNMEVMLKQYLDSRPQGLLDTIHRVFTEKMCRELKVDEWGFAQELVGEGGKLNLAIVERAANIHSLLEFKNRLNPNSTNEEIDNARKAGKLIATLNEEESIGFLSAKGVLPKYGFPIDTVSLDVIYKDDREEAEKIDLSRDLRMAISEFAPPAQIVADGKLWKSYVINTVPSKSWPTYIYYECVRCKRIYPPSQTMTEVTLDVENYLETCPDCGHEMKAKKFIIPIFGFSTAYHEKPKRVGDSRPRSYYSTQTQFWSDTDLTPRQQEEVRTNPISIKGKTILSKYSPGGRLFILNQGVNGTGLYVCPECGYTTDISKVSGAKKHKNKYGYNCSNRLLQKVSLGHQFTTDILKINLPEHIIPQDTSDSIERKDQDLSVLYAILEGASSALGISRNDIDGCVTGKNQLILYDDTPGGSGFVKHVFDHLEEVLNAALKKVDGFCGCTRETSCYGCLRNYGNQFYHDVLSRGLAYDYLNWLLNVTVDHTDEEELIETISVPVGSQRISGIGTRIINNFDSENYARSRCELEDVLSDLISDSDYSDDEKRVFEKLYESLKNENIEKPVDYDRIILSGTDGTIWPAVFWPNARVALFGLQRIEQYKILKTFNWYCYLLNEDMDIDEITSILKEE